MKPAPFKYLTASKVDEALKYLQEYGQDAKILAGGQSLIPTMNFRMAQPKVLIDINPVSELAYIRSEKNGGVSIGALARHYQVEKDPTIAERAPLISQAVPWIGHPQIRNRGTFGGSIVHSDPSAELPAVAVALNGRFRVRNTKKKERWIPANEFFTGLFKTALESSELLLEISIPPLPANTGCSFQQVSRRLGDFALTGVAAVVTLDKKKQVCQEARLVYLGVGEGPVVSKNAMQLVAGKPLTDDLVGQASEMASKSDITPPSDLHASSEFRRHLANVLTKKALAEAWNNARK